MAPDSLTSALTISTASGFSPWLRAIAYPLGKLVLPRFFREILVTGQEYLPATGPVILAPTHRARWDSLLLPYVAGPYVTGRDLRFMTSADEMTGIQGWLVRRMGGFPVDTKNPTVASFRYAIELINRGEMLTIFPEGNIFRDGALHPLKPGLGRIALQAYKQQPEQEVAIVPISFHYSRSVPSWGDRVSIRLEPPLLVSRYTGGSTKAGAAALVQDLTTALEKSIASH